MSSVQKNVDTDPLMDDKKLEALAALAALSLSPAERARFREQLRSLLEYIRCVQDAPLESLPPSEEGVPTPLREDRAERSLVRPEGFSCYLEEGHFKVPQVIE